MACHYNTFWILSSFFLTIGFHLFFKFLICKQNYRLKPQRFYFYSSAKKKNNKNEQKAKHVRKTFEKTSEKDQK